MKRLIAIWDMKRDRYMVIDRYDKNRETDKDRYEQFDNFDLISKSRNRVK